MSIPLVNTSIKSFKAIQESAFKYPASVGAFAPTYYDRIAKPSADAQVKNLFKTQDDINSPLKQIGMNPNYEMSLPCVEVNDLANTNARYTGIKRQFDNSSVSARPQSSLSPLFFSKDRLEPTYNLTQPAFTFNSFYG